MNKAKIDTVLMSHGSGGTLMKRLIEELFYEEYGSKPLLQGDDAADLSCEEMQQDPPVTPRLSIVAMAMVSSSIPAVWG